jgi:hypothetical protein
MLEGPGMQKLDKEQRLETAAMKHMEIHQDLQGGTRTGVHEVNSRILCRVVTDQELDIVEMSAPSKTEDEPASTVSVR